MENSMDTRLSHPRNGDQGLGALGYLPIELRKEIYYMLLAPAYTKYQMRRRGRYEGNEDNTKSQGSRNFIYPHHVSRYDYELSILRASSQTYQEASYTLSETNLFIEVKTEDPNLSGCCQDRGLAVLFNNSRSSNLTKCAMQIEMAHAPAMDPATSAVHSDVAVVMSGRPQFSFIITCNDLPAFCRLLMALDHPLNKLNFILETQLTLTFTTSMSGLAERGNHGRDRLLNPFRTMCGFGSAKIQDLEGGSRDDDLEQKLVSKGVSVHERIQELWPTDDYSPSRVAPKRALSLNLTSLDRMSSGMGGHYLSAVPEDNLIDVGVWRSRSIFLVIESMQGWAINMAILSLGRLNRDEEVFELIDLMQDTPYAGDADERRCKSYRKVGDMENCLKAWEAMLNREPDNAHYQGWVNKLRAQNPPRLHNDY